MDYYKTQRSIIRSSNPGLLSTIRRLSDHEGHSGRVPYPSFFAAHSFLLAIRGKTQYNIPHHRAKMPFGRNDRETDK